MIRAPEAASSSRSPAAPGASRPRRLVSTTCSAPFATSQRATCAPSAPVPPVTSTVPRALQLSDSATRRAVARASRRPNTPEARTAIWSSSPAPARAATSRDSTRSVMVSGRSTRPPQRSGSSSAATRPRPHTRARTGSTVSPWRPVETAPRVAHHSGASIAASPMACTRAAVDSRASASPTASSDSTPATAPPSAAVRSPSAMPARSSAARSSRRTSAPRPVSVPTTPSAHAWAVASPAGVTTSHTPDSRAAEPSDSGFHATWYRQPSTPAAVRLATGSSGQ